jgi:hypothetical protein
MAMSVTDPSQLDYDPFPEPMTVEEWSVSWGGPREKASSQKPSEEQHGE